MHNSNGNIEESECKREEPSDEREESAGNSEESPRNDEGSAQERWLAARGRKTPYPFHALMSRVLDAALRFHEPLEDEGGKRLSSRYLNSPPALAGCTPTEWTSS